MKKENRMMDLMGKRVLVYGSGKSGIGAANLLTQVGAVPVLYDEKEGITEEELLSKLDEPSKARARAGALKDEDLKDLNLVVMSPGVPLDIPNVQSFRERNIPVWGEVELAYQTGKGRVLAITGTNGKTTTTSLLGEIMKAAVPEVFVVGNIGKAYTSASLQTTEQSTIVAEISSFQLETIETFHPSVSAILNITEDHLNRHHTMEEYIRVKELITENQTKKDTCVLNYEDEVLRAFGDKCPADVFFFSSKRSLENGIYLDGNRIILTRGGMRKAILDVNELVLIGVHNFENVMAAVAMAYAAGVELQTIIRVAREFRPVEHRIEFVAEKNGVVWYNDSKGTNPDAAIKGIEAMKWPTLLIAGGYDKNSDYTNWIRSFGGRVKYLVLEGKTKDKIKAAALACGFPEEKIIIRETMREAMEFCRDHAESGDAVLLSPACASWGEFPNYEVRGEKFREYVEKEV
jgi:UDP-N-acetylmuramoylalanine--D-glutamate ligase